MIVVALCIMTDECELIVDYDMVVSLVKILFRIYRYVFLTFRSYGSHVCSVTGQHA